MKKILVTGVAGFIGWKTTQMLLDQGFEVVGIDNMNDYYDVKLKEHRLEFLQKHSGFTFYHTDIEDLQELEKVFTGHSPDAVINLAARAGVRYSIEQPHVYVTTNVNGTLNLLELMKQKGIKKFVLASTSSLYAGQEMPFRETLPVNTPISPYAASKKAAEMLAYTYHYLFELDVTVLRYFTVFGPAGRPDMSPFRFTKWVAEEAPLELFGDGTQSRDFTYVDDIARGTILALKEVGYEIINLGGGKNPVSINTMIEVIEKFIGKKAKIKYLDFRKEDMNKTWADIEKAKEILGWQPEISFEEGMRLTLEWYDKNRAWLKDITV